MKNFSFPSINFTTGNLTNFGFSAHNNNLHLGLDEQLQKPANSKEGSQGIGGESSESFGTSETVEIIAVPPKNYINLEEHPLFLQSWTADPAVLILLPVVFFYTLGVFKFKQIRGYAVNFGHPLAFYIGSFSAFIALCSPIDFLADGSFFMHMAQHMTLMLISAPLICMGLPQIFVMKGMGKLPKKALIGPIYSNKLYKSTIDFIMKPIPASVIFNVFFGIWHIPYLYDLALQSEAMHELEHAMFFYGSLLFWWPMLCIASPHRYHWLVSVLSITVTMMLCSFLSAFFVFSDQPYYNFDPRIRAFDLSPIDDQVLGGLLMWVPGFAMFFIYLTVIFVTQARKITNDDRVNGLLAH